MSLRSVTNINNEVTCLRSRRPWRKMEQILNYPKSMINKPFKSNVLLMNESSTGHTQTNHSVRVSHSIDWVQSFNIFHCHCFLGNDAGSVTLFITLLLSSEAAVLNVLSPSDATTSRQDKEREENRRGLEGKLGQSSATLPPPPPL